MSGESVEAIRKHVRVYLLVFAGLAVLTVVTVAASFLHLSIPGAVLLALCIAGVKGTLVACYFMHLLTERKALYSVLVLCVVFFLAVLLLPVLTESTTFTVPSVS